MKRFGLLLCLALGATAASAQDILTYKDGHVENVKVLRITPKEVTYRDYNDPNGPECYEKRDNLFSVKLENGKFMKMKDSPGKCYVAKEPRKDNRNSAGMITFQPKVGLNIARITDMEDTAPRFGVSAGAELEYQIRDKFSMAAGVLYSMQGIRASGNTPYGYATMTVKVDYINIPLVANVYVYKGLALKFGVQPGFNISSKYSVSVSGRSGSASLSDLGLEVKTFDLAIPVGISYETKSGIVFDARYNIGVTKTFDYLDSRNCVAQLTVGYKFSL